jgi:hypothetical protein
MQLLDLITGMLLRCSFITAGQPGKNGGGFETEMGRGVRHCTVQLDLLTGRDHGLGRKFKKCNTLGDFMRFEYINVCERLYVRIQRLP